MAKAKWLLIGVVVFTLASTIIASVITDAAYKYSEAQASDPIAALQLVWLIGFVGVVLGLMLMRPGMVKTVPFKPFGFFGLMAFVAFLGYWGIGALLGG
jgi:hypothetical protein